MEQMNKPPVESVTSVVEGFLAFLGVAVIYVVRVKTASFKRNNHKSDFSNHIFCQANTHWPLEEALCQPVGPYAPMFPMSY